MANKEIDRSQETPVLSLKNLKMYFTSGHGKNKLIVKAVDDVSFDIYKGEVFGLVGESGCGKTTTGRTIIKLYQPTDGEIWFLGELIGAGNLGNKENIKRIKQTAKLKISDLRSDLKEELEKTEDTNMASALRKKFNDQIKVVNEEKNKLIYEQKMEIHRKKKTENANYHLMRKMQMIFQDPIASLNPRMTVKEIIAEGLRIAGVRNEKEINQRVNEVLETVGLLPEHASRYPHEFSGGQRQRIGIARALIVSPEFIIADEPISALDVSIQAQVINLLNDLRDELGITILFIAHDLSVIKYFSDRIGVMYYGNLVELATSEELFLNPLHPYTRSLLSAVPQPDPRYEKNRKRIAYDPSTHDYSEDKPKLHEIKKGHFVLANNKELEEYKKTLK
ncbi:MAG: ATP-binding cassette domain-containing protein [Candidatus Izemoplasmatales bacterium]|nr:ATP-binding cassette domain-containing protein [Candidatus Izemoplasmatales bacterium]MDD4069572.1 ATP-binding cassette domain-containing protein [Candidatus Izemoplasmatales bacterium]